MVKPTQRLLDAVACSVGHIRAKCFNGAEAAAVLGDRWAWHVTRLLTGLGLNDGGRLYGDYTVIDLLSRELQKLAGRPQCRSVENPQPTEFLREAWSWTEYIDFINRYLHKCD